MCEYIFVARHECPITLPFKNKNIYQYEYSSIDNVKKNFKNKTYCTINTYDSDSKYRSNNLIKIINKNISNYTKYILINIIIKYDYYISNSVVLICNNPNSVQNSIVPNNIKYVMYTTTKCDPEDKKKQYYKKYLSKKIIMFHYNESYSYEKQVFFGTNILFMTYINALRYIFNPTFCVNLNSVQHNDLRYIDRDIPHMLNKRICFIKHIKNIKIHYLENGIDAYILRNTYSLEQYCFKINSHNKFFKNVYTLKIDCLEMQNLNMNKYLNYNICICIKNIICEFICDIIHKHIDGNKTVNLANFFRYYSEDHKKEFNFLCIIRNILCVSIIHPNYNHLMRKKILFMIRNILFMPIIHFDFRIYLQYGILRLDRENLKHLQYGILHLDRENLKHFNNVL